MHQDSSLTVIQLLIRHVERNASARRKGQQHGLSYGLLKIGPQGERTLSQGEFGIAQEDRRIRTDLRPEPFARLAPTERAVEGETVRRERLKASPTLAAGHVLA